MISRRTFNALAAFCLVLSSAISASGQVDERATIETEGKASLEVSPDYVRFELMREESGPNTVGSVTRTLAFEERVRVGFGDMELSPVAIEARELNFHGEGKTSIRLDCLFSIGAGEDIPKRSVRVGEMVDKVTTVGESLKCTVLGPFFEVEDREVVEQEAVARATENALYQADAIASLVGANIISVKSVRVLSVSWGRNSDTEPLEHASNVLGVRCSARVRVTYFYGAR